MPGRVLIIEDNKKNRLLTRDILEYYGYEVIEANDGQEGLKLARQKLPDLILMDIQMPLMDGFTAAGILKSEPATKDVKIIALTSLAMRGDREKIIAAGFDGYIAKPIDTRQLPLLLERNLKCPE
jgi:CheY-like chemotaxis protein